MIGTPITQLPVPDNAAALMKDPARIFQAYTLLNMLLSASVQIMPATSTRGTASLAISGQNIIIPVPLMLPAPIADSTVVIASVSSQLNLLLAALRTTGQLPT